MLMAFAGFTVWAWSDAIIHYLQTYPVVVVAFLSDGFGMLFLCLLAPWLGGFSETFHRPQLRLRIVRGLILCLCGFLSFIAFSELELTKAYAIIFLIPLMSKIVSVLLTGEKITPAAWAISCVGFAGVMIVLRPGWVPLDLGTIAALGVTGLFALGYVLSRYIGEQNQTLLSLALFQHVFVTVALAVPAWNAVQDITVTPMLIFLTALVGLASIVGSIWVAKAYSNAPTAYIAPIHYTQIIWGALFGALLFSEYPDIWTGVGAAVIIAAGLMLIRLGSHKSESSLRA
jgi:drug/metabolite transporter (DMT)-like permease